MDKKIRNNISCIAIIAILLSCIFGISGCSAKNTVLNERDDNTANESMQTDTETKMQEVSGNIGLLKQINMFDQQTGWALTSENEVLYTNGGVDYFQSVHKVETADQNTYNFVNACFVDKITMYLVYFLGENIVVESTMDAGQSWKQVLLPYKEYGGAGEAFISFVDEQNGYLLYCSDPGGGQMTKILFGTKDGGEHFEVISDLSNEISGYPTGISFSSLLQGYIATTYHGENKYLFQTTDCGVTWKSLSLEQNDKISDVSYVEGYPPVFFGKEKQEGKLVLKYVGAEKNSYIEYTTHDGGSTWTINDTLECDSIQSYSFVDEKEGFIVDESGRVFHR
jgi:photosystem II stability/assembly factor-like uncharacterized protein